MNAGVLADVPLGTAVDAPLQILVIENQQPDFEMTEREVRRSWPNATCRRVDSEAGFVAALEADCDVVLGGCFTTGFDSMRGLELLRERGFDVPFIVISGACDEEAAAQYIKRGAADYLLRDRMGRLGPAIARALVERVLRAQKAHAEAELRRSKEYYQRLVESVRAIPWELDPADWRFTYLGPQLTQLLGYTLEDGCDFDRWITKILPEDCHIVRQSLSEALLPARDQDFRHRVIAADGRTVWMRSIVASLRRDESPQLLRGFTVDITETVHAEDALARRAEELARSNQDLEDFAYVASHDLQEPLRMVSSYTQLLAERYRDRLDAEAGEFIGFITDGVTRMQALIRDLLAYSRVTTRARELADTDAGVALARSLTNLHVAVHESAAVVTHGALPVVRADTGQLTQVFQNLIGNSIKFRGAAAPAVHISASESAGEWVFSVADNGIGIDPQYCGIIFGLFQRLHTQQEYGGTGIGLTLAKKIVERHGGRIWVDSEPGKGATFHFTIPKSQGAAA